MQSFTGRIAIIPDDPGWHGRELRRAFRALDFDSQYVSLIDCYLQIATDSQELVLPGFDCLPDAVFVRGIPGGSLEQVIFRMDLLHALHKSGVPVYNRPRSIERTVDKPLTSLLLNRAGLPTPATWICESKTHVRRVISEETEKGNKLVLKPLFGSQGIGVHRIDKVTDLVHDDKFAGIYYLQRYIEQAEGDHHDIRVLVIDGQACAAMRRQSEHWVTNRAQGANCQPLPVSAAIRCLSEKVCQILDVDYAGVDIIEDQHGGLNLIEVNSIPAWYGLQGVVRFNIADRLAHSLVQKIDMATPVVRYSS